MSTLSHNRWSSAGMLLGALALLLSIIHFTAGPFSNPPPTLEGFVAEKVSAVKKGVIAGLKGEEPQKASAAREPDIDSIVDSAGIGLAVVALLCAFLGGMRKENRFSVSGALLFGGGTLAFHAVLFGIAVVCAILLLLIILSLLGGSPV